MAQQQEPEKPVRDDGLLRDKNPYYAGQKNQGELATRKNTLLSGGPGLGYIPGRADSPKLADVHVQDRVPYKRPGFNSGESQAGARPLPRDVEVYRMDAPGGGSFVRHLDGRTTHEFDRPGLVEYHGSLDPNDPDDADERASVAAEIANRDEIHGHRYW
jgi:hypothetical protein